MLRTALIACMLVLAVAAPGGAQVGDCNDCSLGLWDDPGLTTNFGFATQFVPKDIYLGLRLPASESGYQTLEFSVSGIYPPGGPAAPLLFFGITWSVKPTVTIGFVPAPTDPAMPEPGTGGIVAAWNDCQSDVVVARLTLFPFVDLSDYVLEVRQRYPPAISLWNAPAFARCDPPTYTAVRLTGGSYVLNPSLIGVEPRSWSGVKSLFR